MTKGKTLTLVNCALVAALYTVLTLWVAPLAFGAMQFRVSEALTLLAVFSPWMVGAVTLGCLVSNLVGFLMGATLLVDVVVGPIATLLAATMTYLLRNIRIKKVPVLSALMPVIFNGLIIGAMLALMLFDEFRLSTFALQAGGVALGEVIPCLLLGPLLVLTLEKSSLDRRFFGAKAKAL